MSKVVRGKSIKKADVIFPLERINYIILGLGILFIIAGYLALSELTVKGFGPLVVAPILLLIGYCVLIPLGILYKKRDESKENPPPSN